MGQKVHREVNVYYLNEAPPHSLASNLTMSDGKRQSSKG